MKQYQVVNVKTGKVVGFIIGKTEDRQLVLDTGKGTKRLKITPRNESMYRVDVLEFKAGGK